jgi:hypothetical protein
MFLTYYGMTWAHNSASGTIDVTASGSLTAGLILKSTPPEAKLTFGAEVMFTGNTGGSDLNHFGFWLRNYPEIENYQGFRPANQYIKTKLPYSNQWFFSSVNSGISAFENTGTGRIAGRDGFPEFAANTWYDVKVEYIREELPPFAGVAYMRLFVNGVYAGDLKHIGPQSLPVTPGFFLYAGNMKVRRMYGNLAPGITIPTPSFKAVHDRGTITPTTGAPVIFTESTDEGVRDTYGNTFVNVKGRVLDESFQPLRAVVYALSSSRNTFVADTISDQDGFYELIDLRTEDMCTITVFHNGKLENVKKADYTGFGTLSGIYRIRGVAAANVHVRVFSEETGEYLGKVDTDANGGFTIPNVNKDHQFNLVFREPSGAWEDRVSSRRIPELTAFNLQFVSTLASEGDSINGTLKVKNGHEPYTATAENLKPGVKLVAEGNEISFAGETVMQGPYSIPITVKSIDGGEGVFTVEGVAGYMRTVLWEGATTSFSLQSELDRSDPSFNLVKSLLHFDSKYVNIADGVVIDVSPAKKIWLISSGVVLDATEKKFGDGSMKFTGNSGGVYVMDDGSTYFAGDYTAEFWLKVDTTKTTNQYAFSVRHVNGWNTGIYVQSGNKAIGFYSSGYGTIWTGQAANALANNTWVHIALCRIGGTTTLYQNGVSVATTTVNYSTSNTQYAVLGSAPFTASEALFGNIDDFRYTAGLCRYTANFTPPTKAYVDSEDQSK